MRNYCFHSSKTFLILKETMEKILTDLDTVRTQTLPFFDLNESGLAKTYALGKWNIRYLLHHIVDAEMVLFERIRRGIAHPMQVVYGFHQNDWANYLDYDDRPMEISKQMYIANRTSIRYLAQKFYETKGQNQYVHSETGLRTVKEEFDKVVWHNQHHLKQMKQAVIGNIF